MGYRKMRSDVSVSFPKACCHNFCAIKTNANSKYFVGNWDKVSDKNFVSEISIDIYSTIV